MKKVLSFVLAGIMAVLLVSCDVTTNSGEANGINAIQNWYNGNIPAVNQDLISYATSVNGISNINVTSSKFLFGEDFGWYDCHYTILFNCKVDGSPCSGEARAFVKYKDSDIIWFHFEIFRNSDYATIVEHYDESYDKIIEDYYKSLNK